MLCESETQSNRCENGASYEEEFVRILDLVRGQVSDSQLMAQAISNKHLFYVKHLAEGGYKIDQPLPDSLGGHSAFTYSLAYQNGDIAIYLLDKGASPLGSPNHEPCDPFGVIALHPEAKH